MVSHPKSKGDSCISSLGAWPHECATENSQNVVESLSRKVEGVIAAKV